MLPIQTINANAINEIPKINAEKYGIFGMIPAGFKVVIKLNPHTKNINDATPKHKTLLAKKINNIANATLERQTPKFNANLFIFLFSTS